MLAYILQRDRAWLHAHREHHLTDPQIQSFVTLVMRRCAHEPVAYLVGHKEFFGLEFLVTPAVLVPRPETELLVEVALEHVKDRRKALWVADVGTGSGALAVTLAVHLPCARVVATDISAPALLLAQRNAQRHGVDRRILFVQADLLLPVCIPFDIVLANPPYLRSEELPKVPSAVAAGELRERRRVPACCGKRNRLSSEDSSEASLPLAWEPRLALDGGVDGLHVIRRLLAMVPSRLRYGGLFAMELGATQGHAVSQMTRALFPDAEISICRDYAGMERALVLIAAGT